MTAYIDSSALVPLYVPEGFSAAARAVVRQVPQVPYTPLHDLEVSNALALLLGRGLITAEQHQATLGHIRADVAARRLLAVSVDWPEVFATARELSDAHTVRLLTRSLDLLHVAAARTMACRVFVSADDRQVLAARAVGLKVVDIKKTSRVPRR